MARAAAWAGCTELDDCGLTIDDWSIDGLRKSVTESENARRDFGLAGRFVLVLIDLPQREAQLDLDLDSDGLAEAEARLELPLAGGLDSFLVEPEDRVE